ncbi:hypothetical protein ON010_g12876 [Phytophthora cinnamomi]|nr:hypothetical protein ON010_g12876 [Phytophthora cinnamomi]
MQRIELDSDDEDLELDVDENDARYVVTVDSRLEMDTCVKFLAGGVAFRQAAQLFRGMAGLDQTHGAMTEKRVRSLCRVLCAVNLQRLKDLLAGGGVWAFAVVMEYSKTAGSPFLDVRVQFEHGGEIHSVHLVGIVIQDADVAEESGELVLRYLDVVVPSWKTKLIGVGYANEGGVKARACTREITNRLAEECESPIFGDRGLAGKLSQLMSEACRTVFTADFMNTLVALLSHLRRHNLHIPDALVCPKLVEGSWKSAVKSLQWLLANQTSVIQFIEKHGYFGTPGPEWWVSALVVTNVAGRVNNLLRQVRAGKALSHDLQHIEVLMNHLAMMTGAEGPFLASEFLSISCEDIVIGSFSINPVATATFLKAQGNFANAAVNSVSAETYQVLVDATSTFVLAVLTKLNQIISEDKDETDEDSGDSAQKYLPPFLPNALCSMRHQDFVKTMQEQRMRLEKMFSTEIMEKVESQHRALRNSYLLENQIREEIDMQLDSDSFTEVWQVGICAGVDYENLRSFCGALAAVATQRSTDLEFSLVNWQKIPLSQSLTDFALEAILQAQDYRFLACFRC